MYINRFSSNGLIFPVKSKNNQRFIYTFIKTYFYIFGFYEDIKSNIYYLTKKYLCPIISLGRKKRRDKCDVFDKIWRI